MFFRTQGNHISGYEGRVCSGRDGVDVYCSAYECEQDNGDDTRDSSCEYRMQILLDFNTEVARI
jgi:hypothetical protein